MTAMRYSGDAAPVIWGTAKRTGKAALTEEFALPDLPIYGGDTSCLEVETAEGNELLFDLGTGVRPCDAVWSART